MKYRTVLLNNLMWQDEEYTQEENDAVTGRGWEITPYIYGKSQNWKGAQDYCKNLTLNGYNDWRLPNRDELKSIVDIYRKSTIKKEFKFFSQDTGYWSSETKHSNKKNAWLVLYTYVVSNPKTAIRSTRCVRTFL